MRPLALLLLAICLLGCSKDPAAPTETDGPSNTVNAFTDTIFVVPPNTVRIEIEALSWDSVSQIEATVTRAFGDGLELTARTVDPVDPPFLFSEAWDETRCPIEYRFNWRLIPGGDWLPAPERLTVC